MIYSRCIYYLLINADSETRTVYRVSRGILLHYVNHACRLMNANLKALGIGDGWMQLLFELNAETALSDFIERLKSLVSGWICNDATTNYWCAGSWIATFSNEEIPEIKSFIESMPSHSQVQEHLLKAGIEIEPFMPDLESEPMPCHHIIIATQGAKLSLPLKFQSLLETAIINICLDLGLRNVKTNGRRNHMHILCNVPSSFSVVQLISQLTDRLTLWMRSNRHFRKFDSWEHSIAFTVSHAREEQELYAVMHQEEAHTKMGIPNEMSFLYQRLDIEYVLSLN